MVFSLFRGTSDPYKLVYKDYPKSFFSQVYQKSFIDEFSPSRDEY